MRECKRAAPDGALDKPEEVAERVRRLYADVAQVDWSEHLPELAATRQDRKRPDCAYEP
jgi:hypothetical protein